MIAAGWLRPFILSVLLFITGCNEVGHMSKLETMWGGVVSADSVSAERIAVTRLQEYLAKKKVVFQLTATDLGGKVLELDQLPAAGEYRVNVTFGVGAKTFEGRGWQPRDQENIFILFQE